MTQTLHILRQILSNNRGNVLTDELCLGITAMLSDAVACVPTPDNSQPIHTLPREEYKEFVFAAEKMANVIDELFPMHCEQWKEVDERLKALEFRPNYPEYVKMEREGRIVQFTVRKDGELVGYCMMTLFMSMHTQTPCATEDSFYMAPKCRGGFTMIRFTKYIVRCLQQLGFHEIRVTSKVSNKSYLLMERAGFKQCAIQLVMMTEKDHATETEV